MKMPPYTAIFSNYTNWSEANRLVNGAYNEEDSKVDAGFPGQVIISSCAKLSIII